MKTKNYDRLRSQYPEYVSLDQLTRICRIAKKSARFLVGNGAIPAIDTGRQTWRYRILIDDVISYLRNRDSMGSMIPPGAVSSRDKCQRRGRKTFAQLVPQGQEKAIADYFRSIFAEFDDVLTVEDVVYLTGLNKSTISKLLRAGHIKPLVVNPKYLIPKENLLEFVVSRRFLEARTGSEHFIKILGGFEIWKASKSAQTITCKAFASEEVAINGG